MTTMTSPYPARRAGDVICGMPAVLSATPHPRSWRPAANVDAERLHFMLDAYTRTGGVSTGDEIAAAMAGNGDQPVSQLARWIVDREVVSFSWQSVLLLPRFQFRGPAMSRQPSIVTAMRELREVLTDWDAALWFALPNVGLDGDSPADCFSQNPSAVCHAASARRHIALA